MCVDDSPIATGAVIKDLLIIGAGAFSRQIAGAVADVNRSERRWRLLGFLDDDPAKHGSVIDGLRVLGCAELAIESGARLIIGIASWRNRLARRGVAERLALPRERYATIVHPSASIARDARLGAGTAILQNVVIANGSALGDHVLISPNVSLAHDQVLEDFVTIASGAVVAGYVHVGSNSYIGAGSAIRDGVIVHENAMVGIGAVVIHDVPAGCTVCGNPARPMRTRDARSGKHHAAV